MLSTQLLFYARKTIVANFKYIIFGFWLQTFRYYRKLSHTFFTVRLSQIDLIELIWVQSVPDIVPGWQQYDALGGAILLNFKIGLTQ